jgi:hypothetical protein
MKRAEERSAAVSSGDKVSGQRLDEVAPDKQAGTKDHSPARPTSLMQIMFSWQVLVVEMVGLVVVLGFFRKSGAV